MKRFAPCVALLAMWFAAAPAVAAELTPTEFRHEAKVLGRLGNHPNVIQFIGAVDANVTFATAEQGENPLYQDQTHQVENPLFEGAAPPNDPNSIQALTFDLVTFGEPRLQADGIVHRDIAARNVTVTGSGGTYAADPNAFFLLGHDGGPSLRASDVGPVRWMAPEALRLFKTDPAADDDDFFDLLPGSTLDVTYVPEPTGLALLTLGTLALAARRRVA